MRFICLGYFNETKLNALSESDRNSYLAEWLAYDDELRRGGHFLACEALQVNRNAVTLRIRNSQVVVSDGPYSETKEYLGGILVLEARDLNHAIMLMSKHPGVRAGAFEIRPADEEFTEIRKTREHTIS